MTIAVRQDVFDAYWRFAAERQEIFFRRMSGFPPPWSDDPIIARYKFCNAYRASDRVSQYLIRNVIYGGRSQNEEEVVFRVLIFKLFNKIETWEHLERRLGPVTVAHFDVERFASALEERVDAGQAIYTAAYMSCASKAFGYERKHLNHLALVKQMVVTDRIALRLIGARTLEEVFLALRSYPLLGDFMAYQLATDLNYSELIDFSEDSFTVAGPGAIRGIRKCFVSTANRTNAEIIRWMVDNQEREFSRLGIRFRSLFGRRLHAIDCQNLFCETDKYSRVRFPELKSNRARIKVTFRPNLDKISYYYPPKWGINEQIATTVDEPSRFDQALLF